jgi:hypothetical protein
MRAFIVILILLGVLHGSCRDESPFAGSCFDGIKNQNEVDIDCGGICFKKCTPVMRAYINGNLWEADTVSASYYQSSLTFNLRGRRKSSFYPIIQIIYIGPLAPGEYSLDPSSGYVSDISSFVTLNSGSIRISTIHQTERLIEGTFQLTCTDASTGTIYEVTDGQFRLVPFAKF